MCLQVISKLLVKKTSRDSTSTSGMTSTRASNRSPPSVARTAPSSCARLAMVPPVPRTATFFKRLPFLTRVLGQASLTQPKRLGRCPGNVTQTFGHRQGLPSGNLCGTGNHWSPLRSRFCHNPAVPLERWLAAVSAWHVGEQPARSDGTGRVPLPPRRGGSRRTTRRERRRCRQPDTLPGDLRGEARRGGPRTNQSTGWRPTCPTLSLAMPEAGLTHSTAREARCGSVRRAGSCSRP